MADIIARGLALNATQKSDNALNAISNFPTGLKFKGSVQRVADLPTTATQGDAYVVIEDNNREYAYDGTSWIVINPYVIGAEIDQVYIEDSPNAQSGKAVKQAADILQDQINNLKARGRYLSLWNCETGLPADNPEALPYNYNSGDYFIVGVVPETGTLYRPSGSQYTGDKSTATEAASVSVDDVYYYDGTKWALQINTRKEISFVNIGGSPTDNERLDTALSAKQDTLVSGTDIKTINGNDILGAGNLAITTYQPIPITPYGQTTQEVGKWRIKTIEMFLADIMADPTVVKGMAYMSTVGTIDGDHAFYNSDIMPTCCELKVEIMQAESDGSDIHKIAKLTATSTNNPPYIWTRDIEGRTSRSDIFPWRACNGAVGKIDVNGEKLSPNDSGLIILPMTSSITSSSTNSKIPGARSVYDALNGKVSQDANGNVSIVGTLTGAKTLNIGSGNTITGQYASALGEEVTASGGHSHAEGNCSKSLGPCSHAEGSTTESYGECSHAEGFLSKSTGMFTHAEGRETTASGDAAHAEGYLTIASKYCSHAEGADTRASGAYSHAEGIETTAKGEASHAEGHDSAASMNYSHAEGTHTTASGIASHAEGSYTTASSDYSHSEGNETKASGIASHAEGYVTTASGAYSHSGGLQTVAGYTAQIAIGKWNNNKSDTLLEVGNGTSASNRSNAFEVKSNGQVISGSESVASDTKALTTKKYVDDLIANTVYQGEITGTSAEIAAAVDSKVDNGFWSIMGNYTGLNSYGSLLVIYWKSQASGKYFSAQMFFPHGDGNTNKIYFRTSPGGTTPTWNAWQEINPSQVNSKLTSLESDIDTLESSVSTLSGTVSTLSSNVSTLSGKVDTCETNVSTLTGKVTTCETNVTNLATTVSTLPGKKVITSGNNGEIFNLYDTITYEGASVKNTASGAYSHADGIGTEATGEGSFASGILAKARGKATHAFGYNVAADYYLQTAVGTYNDYVYEAFYILPAPPSGYTNAGLNFTTYGTLPSDTLKIFDIRVIDATTGNAILPVFDKDAAHTTVASSSGYWQKWNLRGFSYDSISDIPETDGFATYQISNSGTPDNYWRALRILGYSWTNPAVLCFHYKGNIANLPKLFLLRKDGDDNDVNVDITGTQKIYAPLFTVGAGADANNRKNGIDVLSDGSLLLPNYADATLTTVKGYRRVAIVNGQFMIL